MIKTLCATKNKAHKLHDTVVNRHPFSKRTAFLRPIETGHLFLPATQKPNPEHSPSEKRSGGRSHQPANKRVGFKPLLYCFSAESSWASSLTSLCFRTQGTGED